MVESVGFLGLGVMGSRMSRRLIESGHDVVAWSRTHSKAETLADATPAATAVDVAQRCDLVLGCLLDDTAVAEVYRPLVAAARPGQIFVEHGTFSPALARELSAAAAEHGAWFLDAPVTGGPEGAAAGTLVAMVGGDPGALATAAPVTSHYVAESVLVGPSGRGLQLKLVNQLLVSVHMAAAAEAGALLLALGIPIEVAMPVLGGGWAASAMLARELPRVLASDFDSAGATIGGLVGVQELVSAIYAEAGIPPRLMPVVRELFSAAAVDRADSDPAALVESYQHALAESRKQSTP